MNYLKIVEIVRDTLLSTLPHIDKAEITETSRLKDELGIDSMSSLTFLMMLEDNIPNFVVDPETLTADSLNTVQSVSNYIMFTIGIK